MCLVREWEGDRESRYNIIESGRGVPRAVVRLKCPHGARALHGSAHRSDEGGFLWDIESGRGVLHIDSARGEGIFHREGKRSRGEYYALQ